MSETDISETELAAQVEEVTDRLQAHGIPLEQWGVGKAKTVTHLAKEILEGETVLTEKSGELLRSVELVHLDVRYVSDGVELQLLEDRQEFADGRERRRGLAGLSEKMKPGEDPLSSARRALGEELGVNSENEVQDLGSEQESQTSPSYPGLTTEYTRHEMRTYLPKEAFKPEGYVERQQDKSTFFVWAKA